MKLHFHSDCPFFAGCERMLVNFWTDPSLREQHEVSFSFRKSAEYTSGLYSRFVPDFPIFPMSLPTEYWPKKKIPLLPEIFTRVVRLAFRLTTYIPFFIFDIWVLARLFRRQAPDTLHINNGGYPAARSARSAAIAARLAGVKNVIMVVNNLAMGYRSPSRWIDYPIDRLVVRSTSKFVTGSQAAAERLRNVLTLGDDQIQSIHNGIGARPPTESRDQTRNRLKVNPDFGGIVIGVVALIEPRKGHRVLLEALTILLKERDSLYKRLIVWLEGDGPIKEELESFTRDRGLSDVVHFIGDETNVADMINAVDVIVLPSVGQEDFPNVSLEAMALGKAVVASAIAGTPEQIVPGETGFLVEPGNAEMLADSISQLIEAPELCESLGTKGRERFCKMFEADIAVRKYMSLYDSLKVGSP